MHDSRTAVASEIPQHPSIWRGKDLARTRVPGISTGFVSLDAELPGGGWPVSNLTEIMPAHEGIGELRFLSPALAALSQSGKYIAWINPPYLPYAPAITAARIILQKVLIVKTAGARETLWAAEQALRANACGAVLVWPGPTVDYAALRRLQMAAEGSHTISFIFRPVSAGMTASPAPLRLRLETSCGDLAVQILKRRGNPASRPVVLAARELLPLPTETGYARNTVPSLDRHSSAGTAGGALPPSSLHA